MSDTRLDDLLACSSGCRHDQGWGAWWSGGRYCLGCGLPFTEIERRALRAASLILDLADEAEAPGGS